MEICRRRLAEAFMQRTYWSMDDIVLSHTGLNQAVDYGASVRQPPKPLHYSKFERAATPKPQNPECQIVNEWRVKYIFKWYKMNIFSQVEISLYE